MRGLILLRDAALVVALSTVLALVFNALRDQGIPLVAGEPYRILVPCPEPGGVVLPLTAGDIRHGAITELLIDARTASEVALASVPGAKNVPFDFLDAVPEAVLAELAASRAERVVVFGDGALPDSGQELAKELSGRGIRNVCFVQGGFSAVQEALSAARVQP